MANSSVTNDPPEQQRLFDVLAAVVYLKSLGAQATTKSFARGLIGSGAVPHLKIGKRFYLTRASLDAWIGSHENRRRR